MARFRMNLGGITLLAALALLSAASFEAEEPLMEYTVAVTVDSGSASVLTNQASVATSTPEGNPGDESVSEETTVTARADLVIRETGSPDLVIAGTKLTYTVTVTNNGPSYARYVEVSDTLAAGVIFNSTTGCAEDPTGVPTCTLGTIAAGASKHYSISATVRPGAVGSVSNQASVSSQTPEGNPGDESVSGDTRVDARADLVISTRDSVDPVIAGNALTYAVTVTNNGPSDARDVQVTDDLPAGVVFRSTTGCAEDGSGGGSPICTLGTIAANSSKSYSILVGVSPDATGRITNQASVSSSKIEAEPGDQAATEGIGGGR